MFAEWQALKRNANGRSETQMKKEQAFKADFNDLFDVAHADALTLIKITEDREFLVAQREKGRRGCMSSVDKQLEKKEK